MRENAASIGAPAAIWDLSGPGSTRFRDHGRRATSTSITWANRLLGFLLAALTVMPSFGIDPSAEPNAYSLEHWGPRAGFPEETIFDITQTTDGYLWIGTPLGLVRFDGNNFVTWDHRNVKGLEPLRAASLTAASDGSLWMRNAEGVVWRHRDGGFQQTPQLAGERVHWMGRDSSDRIWLLTPSGIHLWTTNGIERDLFRLDAWRGLVSDCYLDREQRLWLRLNGGGLVRLSPSGQVQKQWVGPDAPAGGVVQSMVQDKAGVIWFATTAGLFRIDGDCIQRVRGERYVTGSMIRLAHDRGAVWISAEQGLLRHANDRLDLILPPERLDNSNIASMVVDREGSLWLGSQRDGLYRVKDSKFLNLTKSEGLSSNLVYSVYRDRGGSLWIGTDQGLDFRSVQGGLSHYGREQGLPDGGVRAIDEDTTGRIWIGGDWGLVYEEGGRCKRVRSISPGTKVRAIANNQRGGIWVATPNGLGEISRDSIRWLQTPPEMQLERARHLFDAGEHGLLVSMWQGGIWRCLQGQCEVVIPVGEPGKRVSAFETFRDSQNSLWLASSLGLAQLVPTGGKLEPRWLDIGSQLSIPEREFYQIGEDSRHRVWLAARRSLIRIDRNADGVLDPRSARQYDLHDGLSSANFGVARQGWRAGSPGGVLWFANMIGLVGIKASRIHENPLPPPVHIEKISADGRDIPHSGKPVLPAGIERLQLTFAGLSLFDPSKVRYRFKLEGFDQEWVEAGKRNYAEYTGLGKGDYRFRVTACNNDGVWSSSDAVIEFSVGPHIWERNDFRSLVVVLFLLLITLAFRLRLKSLLRNNMLLERRVKERTEELERARLEAEQAGAAKTEFLATMSHEIRTPLNGVLGTVSLLEKTPLTPEQQELAQTISSCGQGLLTVVNDVLHLSRIEAGRIELERKPVNIRRTCEQVIGLFRQSAEEKSLRLSLLWPDGVNEWYETDEARIRQVLMNLVGNAVKFTDAGFVEIQVSSTPVRQDQWRIEFAVCDSGVGLSREQLAKLFRRFARASNSETRKHGGTGLGLAISKGLAERMGGVLEVTSELGIGSCFKFRIPVTGCQAQLPASDEVGRIEVSKADAGPILLAEDNAVNVKIARIMLNRLGYQVTVAGNGREVLEALEQRYYSLILMDCEMPVMDGFETTRAIRVLYPDHRIVIIAMTANAMAGDREKCLAAGMDDYLAKPVVLSQLAECLDRWKVSSAEFAVEA